MINIIITRKGRTEDVVSYRITMCRFEWERKLMVTGKFYANDVVCLWWKEEKQNQKNGRSW